MIQERLKAEHGIEASRRHAKPLLGVTELMVSNPENPAPATLREHGRLCYPSAHRAVRALGALVRWREALDGRPQAGGAFSDVLR